jgi:protein required for attachment to host cells
MQRREVLMKTWVVVASAARARFFESNGKQGALQELKDMLNPEDRLLSQELKSDKPGRAFDHMGGQRHAVGTAVDPKEQEAIRFAKEVVGELDAERHHNRFDQLCLVASPHFLGLLRDQMREPLARRVKGEVINDLTREDANSVHQHVAHLL